MPPNAPLFNPSASPFSPWQPDILPLAVYTGIVLALMAILLFLSDWLGVKVPGKEKSRPYESGVIPTGPGAFPYPVPFFLIAVFYLLFDVETAYIVSWAAAWDQLGWAGYARMSLFIVILILGLAYAWRKGGLDWDEGDRP